ncbi:helix-turn-helix domain-containing protein [Streptomyces sp. 8L]|uniref:helix-turn-helix domain-containing protein n=1 Tax=Streptomyces sp. 8L TaxID=2877242 RepID=UPI001CD54D33|nr:helix-turn-helix transcriptional regulator [Streptomyces sp. 8L]MCA1219758.1 helix-turn-helix transcriptional regulator [Streptomyces sp. 8L]
MPYAEELDPSDSVLSFYVTDLRRRREDAGISQRDFAKMALMSPSLLNKIEAAKRLPTKELSALADEKFGTGEYFTRLWHLVIKYAHPKWFRPYTELEEAAVRIRSFQVQVMPGLLQTEDYARAVLGTRRDSRERIEEMVSGRIERQHILKRPNPPEMWVVLDESVLHRRTGDIDTMRGQFEHVIHMAESTDLVLQVIPYDVGMHAGCEGSFASLTLDQGPNVVYVDGFLEGQLLGEREHIKTAERVYDLLAVDALSMGRSMDLIKRALTGLHT